MPRKLGYFASVGVGAADIAASFMDEMIQVPQGSPPVNQPLGNKNLSALNVERIVGLVGTGLGSMYTRGKMQEALTIAHYAYVPLAMRTIVNLARKTIFNPPLQPYRGRELGQQVIPSPGVIPVQNPGGTFGGGYRPFT